MTDWYYHAPGEGRMGPYSAEDLRKRYRERRIQRDTLVWHDRMGEWKALDLVSDEVGIDDIVPDSRMPPPILPDNPLARPAVAATASGVPPRAPGSRYARKPLGEKRTLPRWALVVIVLVAVLVPLGVILASVALPAYQDYARRASADVRFGAAGEALAGLTEQYHAQRGSCPHMGDPEIRHIAGILSQRIEAKVVFSRQSGGRCMFEVTAHEPSPGVGERTLRYVGWPTGEGFEWECSGEGLNTGYRASACASPDDDY